MSSKIAQSNLAPVVEVTGKSEKVAVTKHIFKVCGCLKISQLALDYEIALARTKRMWPRSEIEYVGEEFSHWLGDYEPSDAISSMTKPLPKRDIVRTTKKPKKSDKSVEQTMTDTIGANFSGA